ncbi:hypothetical protein VKT23_007851 [Stygiomarasmius scandens]|uniref:Cytochrome P450 n=1 Tax=Marasmiellus scandens TaxID=2682957 RepID=A0ABR1JMU7_9AGAR
MVRHPHLQRTAQAEIDKVLKKGHLPDFNDQESLPFVTAIVKETLRHSPVTPLACPHRSTEDDIYRGWFIPKNSIMLPSIWTLTHDPEVYPDPFAYKPERFLNSDGTLNPEVPDPKNFTFGFGRRICPARYMAWSSLWITVASVLSVFDIMPSLDQDGKEIVPLPKYTNGIVVHPVPFKCRLVPRSEAHEELIRSTVSNLEAVDIF